ncbi:hydrogenase maturation protease [Desulfofundulus thermosubterraneus]|uniref:Hydrogenase maturation protease n=1 Tax=Desulfofundulus thermosubterraneus DSM 16057 TaxID=1121432 RepID=A0A1M6M167_9FIRM|nr:hydrogenase maturation protease [Desulfofundulus thermosubterraneus]SHJ77063.1 hydrogenase maturation protease [Desulfofundulus thermosubterraneus DSM 16057]
MRTIVVGIGNPVLRDDSVGIKVAQHFEGLVDTEILMTTDFKVLDKILGYERAIIVDGVRLGKEPGTVLEFDVDDLFYTCTFSGTHNLSLPATLKIGYQLFGDEMPRDIKIIAIEVEDITTFSKECTPAVQAAIPKVVERVKRYLENGNGAN